MSIMSNNLLNTTLVEKLTMLDYVLLPNKRKPGEIMLFKETDNGMILSLFISKSKLYRERFDGYFYLALSYTCPMASPIFLPEVAYQRIIDSSNNKDKSDLTTWWNSNNIISIQKFVEATKYSEPIFLQNRHIILTDLLNPQKYERYKKYMSALHEVLTKLRDISFSSYNEVNTDIYEVFYEITKQVLKRRKDPMNNKYGIEFMSFDAINCHFLSSQKNKNLIEIAAKEG